MNNRQVSITIAAYNVQEWLEECLDSIVCQTFTDFECIIVDDCSSDITPTIVAAYARKDPRFRLVQHGYNQGLAAARKTGLSACKGKYIWQIDGDDYIAHDALEILYSAAERDRCDIVRGRFLEDHNGQHRNPKWFMDWDDVSNTNLIEMDALFVNPFGIWLNFCRRSFVERINIPDSTGINLGEDLIFNSYIYAATDKISLTSEIIYYYRSRAGSYTKQDITKRRYLEEAQAHAIGFKNWESFPVAQMDFAIRGAKARIGHVRNSCQVLQKSTSLKVINEYKKLYEKWDPDFAFKLLDLRGHDIGWQPTNEGHIMRFAERMYCAKSEDIWGWMKG